MILQLRLCYRFSAPRNIKFAAKNSAILLHNSKTPFSTTVSSFMPRKPKLKPFENEEEAVNDAKWKDYAPGARNLFDEVRSSTNFGSVRVDDDNMPQIEKEVIESNVKTEVGGSHTESFSKINAHKSDYLSLLIEEKDNRFSPLTPLVPENLSTPAPSEEESVAKQHFSFGKFRENKTIPVKFEQSQPSEQNDLNYFDELMFKESYGKFSSEEALKVREVHVDASVEIAREQSADPELNLIDKEYFSQSLAKPTESKNVDNFALEKSDDLNFIDEQFFTPQPESIMPLAESAKNNLTFSEQMMLLQEAKEDREISKQPPKIVLEELSSSHNKVQTSAGIDQAPTASWFESDMGAFDVAAFDPVVNEVDSDNDSNDSELKARMKSKRAQKLADDMPEKPLKKSTPLNSKKFKAKTSDGSALEYVRKLRKSQDGQTASKHPHDLLGHHLQDRFVAATSNLQPGSNIEKRLMSGDDDEAVEHVGLYEDVRKYKPPDLDTYTKQEVKELLFSKIIYNDHDIVAMWKPHGLPMFCGESKNKDINKNRHQKIERFSMEYFLPDLAKKVEVEKLYEVHRLDSTTTGVILYAKTKEMELKLRKLFYLKKVEKSYLCICNGVPQGDSGVIDIPVGEGIVGGRRRMTLRPDFDASQIITNKKSSSGNVSKAVTEYRIVSSHNNASLVQTKMLSGKKHQIRLHLGLGLGCPILGDHKFSYPDQLGKPQQVKGDILQRLNIRKSKSRELPIFLHARRIFIPDIIPDGNLVITASLPHFFSKTMRRLKLKGSRSEN